MEKLTKYKDISAIWLDYKDALRNYILRIVKDKEMANDLSHEVLMKVYASCCSNRPIKNIRSWLFQIAYNTCMDYFRKQSKKTEINCEPHATDENPIYREASEFVEPLINLLPEKYGQPLRMADIKGLKQQEVADKLGLSLTATKSRIQRARVLLKEKITECFNVEVDKNGIPMAFDIKESCCSLKIPENNCRRPASF